MVVEGTVGTSLGRIGHVDPSVQYLHIQAGLEEHAGGGAGSIDL